MDSCSEARTRGPHSFSSLAHWPFYRMTQFRSSALAGYELQRRDTRAAVQRVDDRCNRPSGGDQNCPSTSFLCRSSARRASLSYSSATLMSLHLDVSSSSDSAFLRVASARLRQCLASEN